MKDTLMILGANTLQIPLIERANQLGYNTLVISPNREEPGHKISKNIIFVVLLQIRLTCQYVQLLM